MKNSYTETYFLVDVHGEQWYPVHDPIQTIAYALSCREEVNSRYPRYAPFSIFRKEVTITEMKEGR